MSWGTELWDKFDDVLGHTQKGVDVCEKFSQFTKERCNIELEYANKLRRLVKSYHPKKKEDDESTSSKGFLAMTKEINDIAGQHETISESLQAKVWNESQNLAQELKQERKKALQDSSKFLGLLQNQFNQLDKVKKNSEKAFREMEKASESWKKTNEDQNMSRNEVEKAKQYLQQKQQAYEQSKHEYAAEVQKTNSVQREHYNTSMPQVFSNLEIMEDRRVAKMKALIVTTAEIEKSTLPILNQCIEDMIKAASIVNFQQEKQAIIDSYKTGFAIPSDIPFEDISSSANCKTNTYPSMHGTGSSKKERKRPGLFGILAGPKDEGNQKDDYSHLPPNQQMRQLMAKTDELKAAIAKETLERDALLKMQDVYKKNSSLGDPKVVAKQLDEKSMQLDQLGQELKKYEEFIAEAGKRPAGKVNSTNANISQSSSNTVAAPQKNLESPVKTRSKPAILNKPSISQRNSRTDSNSEVPKSVNLKPMFPTTPPGASKISAPQSQESFEDDDEFIDGTICTAIYGYDGSTEGSLAMKAGDELTVVENDQGDGWVLVRTGEGQQGYVPTTYIKYNE